MLAQLEARRPNGWRKAILRRQPGPLTSSPPTTRDNNMASCYYCRRQMNTGDPHLQETKDHYHPKSRVATRNNFLVSSCYACNQVKGDMHPNYFKIVMRDIPEWWRLAKMKGPRGRRLWVAMMECGFDPRSSSNGQPYEEWWTKPSGLATFAEKTSEADMADIEGYDG